MTPPARPAHEATPPARPAHEATPQETGERVEQLLGELRAVPGVAERAEELVRVLMELYGQGLGRVAELLGDDGLRRLAADELVASLLILHGLHPVAVEDRIEAALERVRPHLSSPLSYLGVGDDGVVRLAMPPGDGCTASTSAAVEDLVMRAAPEVTGVVIEGLAAPRLLQIQPLGARP